MPGSRVMAMLERPISLAVVGHVNAGRTSIVRTLSRHGSFGEVADAPGTTSEVASILRGVKGAAALRFHDTPGFDDPVALMELVNAIPHGATPAERLRSFLRRPEAGADFAPEAKALRTLLDADAVIHVIDAREAVLPKFHCELALLAASAKPVLPLLNRAAMPGSRVDAWQAALNEHGLLSAVEFDAEVVHPETEDALFRKLGALLAHRRPEVFALAAAVQSERAARRDAALKAIASHLVGLVALRHTLGKDELANDELRAKRLGAIRLGVIDLARQAQHAVLAAHGFADHDVLARPVPELDGRWEGELLSAEAMKIGAGKFGVGAAVGAAMGLGVDVAMMGASLGAGAAAGAAVGAALGGTANQANAPLGRAMANLVTGRKDVFIEDGIVVGQGTHLLALSTLLASRGHGATAPIVAAGEFALSDESLKSLLDAVSPARSHVSWANGEKLGEREAAKRQQLVVQVAASLGELSPNARSMATTLPSVESLK